MSKSIAQNILDALSEYELVVVHLFEFYDGSTNYYYTDADVPIYAETVSGTGYNIYSPRGFTFGSIMYSSSGIVDTCEINLDNLDNLMTSIFLDNAVQDTPAAIYLCVLDSNNDIVGNVALFSGSLDSFELDETQVKITITSIFNKWAQQANGTYSASCRWKVFKGVECQYGGAETTCDRSYERCTELTNTDNFGGFKYLPELEDLKIWWGPTPDEQRNPK